LNPPRLSGLAPAISHPGRPISPVWRNPIVYDGGFVFQKSLYGASMQEREGADSAVKQLLVELNKGLRPFGFRRRGQTFARQSSECWQVVNVQLSRFSPQNEKSLTVNISVQSKTVLHFRGEDSSKPPLYYACPITFRIGWLMQK
jgi:hypothetical protein